MQKALVEFAALPVPGSTLYVINCGMKDAGVRLPANRSSLASSPCIGHAWGGRRVVDADVAAVALAIVS
jgi:hypothetical protein